MTQHKKTTYLLDDLERDIERVRRMNPVFHTIDSVMESVGIDDHSISAWGFSTSIDVGLPIDSIRAITPVLSAFASKGYHQYQPMEKKESQYGGFLWFLRPPWPSGVDAPIAIHLFGRVRAENDEEESAGETCRLVQVGEETVIKPVYRVICSEGETVNG
jgi:hypothetical protein